ncbi:unnamed protein product [Blepharisma stoltei]|uniref:Uncharacterized protein n=1 Tax=Blepharisma stoltei TaxID=1481888 RepID=A0AAU9K176_9CILI|nr:unnamed protein product [Blepharisma stoltei]
MGVCVCTCNGKMSQKLRNKHRLISFAEKDLKNQKNIIWRMKAERAPVLNIESSTLYTKRGLNHHVITVDTSMQIDKTGSSGSLTVH